MANLKFTNKVLKVMEGLSLSENDVNDIYVNGNHETASGGGKKATRKYESYGYELGVFYFIADNGDIVITHVWKRSRR